MSAGRTRRRPAVQISPLRAARLYRLVRLLAEGPQTRAVLLRTLGIGLRTFYRETGLLRRVGVSVRLEGKVYLMKTAPATAAARLPFPDPRLTFAEIKILAQTPGEVGERLAILYEEVLRLAEPPPPPVKGRSRKARTR